MKITRDQARHLILRAANRHRAETLPPYTMRHINQAVNKVRNRVLVRPAVLEAAGFRTHGPNYRKQQA